MAQPDPSPDAVTPADRHVVKNGLFLYIYGSRGHHG